MVRKAYLANRKPLIRSGTRSTRPGVSLQPGAQPSTDLPGDRQVVVYLPATGRFGKPTRDYIAVCAFIVTTMALPKW